MGAEVEHRERREGERRRARDKKKMGWGKKRRITEGGEDCCERVRKESESGGEAREVGGHRVQV